MADVKSTNGRLDFKPTENSTPAMRLNSNGLGIGTIQPSTNLHVDGNAIITDELHIGSSSSGSNLYLSGSLGQSYTTITSNTTLSDTSLVLVDTTSDNIRIDLPYAGNVAGRIYQIKKINSSNEVFIYANNSTIDGTKPVLMNASNQLPSLKVISYNNEWKVLNAYQTDTILASDNLVGYWTFDESSGSTVYDLGPSSLHGSITSVATGNMGLTGKVGNAMSFDGVDDQIDIPHHTSLNLNDDWSICFWYQKLSYINTYPGTFRKGASGTADGYIQWYGSTGRIYHKRNNDQSFDQLNIYNVGTWVHITYTYDDSSNTISIYIDGEFNDSDTIDYGTNNGTADLWLGRGDEHGNGILDDFRIYNKVLSVREIQLLNEVD